jgi:hypothetical protein
MIEIYLTGILIVIFILSFKKNTGNDRLSQKNVDHIEFGPAGPILKTRLNYSRHEVRPTPTQKGYYSFLNFKKE